MNQRWKTREERELVKFGAEVNAGNAVNAAVNHNRSSLESFAIFFPRWNSRDKCARIWIFKGEIVSFFASHFVELEKNFSGLFEGRNSLRRMIQSDVAEAKVTFYVQVAHPVFVVFFSEAKNFMEFDWRKSKGYSVVEFKRRDNVGFLGFLDQNFHFFFIIRGLSFMLKKLQSMNRV